MPDNPHLIDESQIPENWAPVNSSPTVPGRASVGAPAPIPHEMPQFFSGSIAPGLQHDGAFVATEMASPRIPKTALMPFGNQANPSANAAATSTAKIVAQQVVAAIPPPVSSGGSSADADIIAGINSLTFGGQDSFSQRVLSSTTHSIGSTSVTSNASSVNEFAIVAAVGTSSPSSSGQNPGGWTALSVSGMYTKVIPAAGPLTVGQAYGNPCNSSAQTLLLLKTNGTTPVVTLRGSQTGNTSLTTAPFTPGAGNTLLWTIISVDYSAPPAPIITDSQGLNWQLLTNLVVKDGATGTENSGILQYIAQNVKAVSMTASLNIGAATGGSGNWALYEISNVNLGSGAYTFQTSDNLQMVKFTGGANVVATLPSPALAAGWQALASNNSIGNVTLTSAAFINNSSTPLTLGPGSFTWIFSDGTNYWLTTVASPANTAKIASQWLDSYNPLTGLFGQSQPSVLDLSTSKQGSGSIVLATAPNITNPTLLGCTLGSPINVANVFVKYNNIATVGNGMAAEYANVANATAVANIASTLLYTPPANGLFRLSYYVIVNRAATTSSTLPDLQFTWTDPDNSTVQTFGPVDSATPSANTLTTTYSGTVIVSAKANTNINYQTGVTTAYASVGATAMRYSIYIMLEAL